MTLTTSDTARPPGRTSRALGRSPWVWFLALVLLGAVVGAAAGVYLRDGGSSTQNHPRVAGLSASALSSWAATVGHPVYWAGPEQGYRYELTHTTDGRIYIRYLPAGVAVGTSAPDYLTVGTYPVKDALATVQAIGGKAGGSLLNLGGGAVAAVDPDHTLSIYIAYPDASYEVEVYDPSPRRARQLVTTGAIVATGASRAQVTPMQPTTASIADLRALASSSGYPVYWAGPQTRATYELSELSDGRIYVRYLPKGAKV